MQGSCSSCGNRITIDDAKVPDRPFQVKCPKCQSLVRFPGKGAAAVTPAPAPASASAPAEEPEPPPPPPSHRDVPAGEAGRALVALPDKGQAASASAMLARLGFEVETLDDASEGGRLLEQGVYDVVVTARMAAQGTRESLYQRIGRMPSEPRREMMLVIVGDEFKTGDGTQAWACLADLVVNSREVGTADSHFRSVSAERARVYQPFKEARKRLDAAGG
ncbi:MAG TPA: zinc-ribbon domain-containing protein [Vicinamibacteria bacterium]|nr:zinc-ribbon domain-containing protein [Vicinamibacteria bacterium]